MSNWEDSFGNKVKNVHAEGTCKGEYCTIHKWSDHHMVEWPMMWRTDRYMMERVCKHGIGHPDPDEIATDRTHGCDGCCTPPEGVAPQEEPEIVRQGHYAEWDLNKLIRPEEVEMLKEIQRLLDEGLAHYLTYESHCKSSEGWVAVEISFGNSWERFDGPVQPKVSCTVYSYALGPQRTHYFEWIEDALTEVRKWHKAEMEFDPEEEGEDGIDGKALMNIFSAKKFDDD